MRRSSVLMPAAWLAMSPLIVRCASSTPIAMACYGGVNSATPDPFNLNRIRIAEWFGTPDQFGFELLTGRA